MINLLKPSGNKKLTVVFSIYQVQVTFCKEDTSCNVEQV